MRNRYIRPRLRPVPGTMNKLEIAYSSNLELQKKAGEIIDYKFEAIKFRLADKTFYTPDFIVIKPDVVELHEVKGFWEDDARVKIKVAAAQFWWYKFVGVKYTHKLWEYEDFN